MSDTPLGKMIIQMGIDDVNFAKGITGVTRQLTALKGDLRASETSFAAFGKGIDGVEGPMNILTKTIETQKRQLDLLKKSYQGSLIDGKATASTQNYASQISRANAQLVELQAKLKAAAVEQYKQTSILPKMSVGLEKVSGGLNSVATKSLPATVAITGVFAKGIQDATNFNGKMTEIQALLSDGTAPEVLAKEIDTLSSKSKEWAQQYGISTDSINDGMEEMIKRGYSFNQTVGAMPAVLDASKASGEDFGTVMNTSTSILEQFNLKSNDSATMLKNTQRVTDSLTFVANETAAGFSDMGEAMQYVGPVAHGLGMDVEQTAAAIGLLSNNGIEGQAAGTGLRSVLTSLEKPTNTSEVAFQKLGISTEDFKKGSLTLPGIIQDITKSTAGMTDAQKASLLAQAFGTKGQTAMNVLVSQGAQALEDLTNKTDNATGYTKKLSDQMNNSDKNAFAKAKASLEVLSIDLGEKLLPSILPVVKEVDNLAGSFAKLDPQTQQFIIKMAIGAAAIAPTAKALSGLTGLLSGVTGGLAKLGAAGAGKIAFAGIATEAEGATAAIGGIAPEVEVATAAISGAGGLEAGIGGLVPILAGIGPIAGAALGVAGLAGLIIGVKTVVDDAKERLKDFGTIEVPKETVDQLNTFKQKVNDAKTAMDEFGATSGADAQKVIDAVKSLGKDTEGDIDKGTQKLEDAMKRSGYTADQITEMKNRGDQAKKVVEDSTNDITQVYVNAAKRDASHRQLSVDEQARISSDMKVVFESEADALKLTGEKKNNVLKALNGDFNNMSKSQAQQVVNDMRDMRTQANNEYDQYAADQKTLLDGGVESQDQYNENMAAAEQERVDKLNKYGTAVAQAEEVLRGNLQQGEAGYAEWRQNAEEQVALYTDKTGEGLDDLLAKLGDVNQKTADSGNVLAKYAVGMSDDTKKANDAWNEMIFDPKTGEIKTNIPEAIGEALKGQDGWDNMQFILKNANLTTNARLTVAQALIANGQWNQMTPDEKNLVVNGQQGLLAVVNSTANLAIWNAMPATEKNLLMNNKDFLQNSNVAEQTLQNWNSIPDPIKKLLGDNSDFKGITGESTQILEAWNSATPEAKKLLAINLTKDPTMSAQAIINTLVGKDVVLSAQNNTGGGVNDASKTINQLQGKTVGIDADPSQAKGKVQGLLDFIPTSKTISIVANTSVAPKATGDSNFAGGLAMVNDQKGSLYHELITLPTGQSFIPQGRDVVMPLPKGTSILKASETAKLFPKIPHFADGIGRIPADTKISRGMKAIQQKLQLSATVISPEINSKQLDKVITLLTALVAKEPVVVSNAGSQKQPTLREQNQALDRIQKDLGYLFSNN